MDLSRGFGNGLEYLQALRLDGNDWMEYNDGTRIDESHNEESHNMARSIITRNL